MAHRLFWPMALAAWTGLALGARTWAEPLPYPKAGGYYQSGNFKCAAGDCQEFGPEPERMGERRAQLRADDVYPASRTAALVDPSALD